MTQKLIIEEESNINAHAQLHMEVHTKSVDMKKTTWCQGRI